MDSEHHMFTEVSSGSPYHASIPSGNKRVKHSHGVLNIEHYRSRWIWGCGVLLLCECGWFFPDSTSCTSLFVPERVMITAQAISVHPLLPYLTHTHGGGSLIVVIIIQAFKQPLNIITSQFSWCSMRSLYGEENRKNVERSQERDWWMDGKRQTSSIIKGKTTPLLFPKPHRQANSSTDRENGSRGFCFVLIFIFSASQQLHPSLRDTWGGGGEHKQKEGCSAPKCNAA